MSGCILKKSVAILNFNVETPKSTLIPIQQWGVLCKLVTRARFYPKFEWFLNSTRFHGNISVEALLSCNYQIIYMLLLE